MLAAKAKLLPSYTTRLSCCLPSVAVARVVINPCMTAVAVGVLDAMPDLQRLPAWVMSTVHDSVFQHGVRCLTGVFGSTKEQMSELAQNLPVATSAPLYQPWKGSSAAVAAVQVFPSYTLLLGSCGHVTVPPGEKLALAELALQRGWVSAVADLEEEIPQWWPWTWRQIAWSCAGDMNWGHVKMKPVDQKRWIPGVHQLVFWCGTAQTGQGAKARWREAASSSTRATGSDRR